jgi:hypothetical protein
MKHQQLDVDVYVAVADFIYLKNEQKGKIEDAS